MLLPPVVRLGPIRMTLYGACAALGVVGGMTLSGWAAKRAGLRSETAWDAGLVAVTSCFVASRLLLVLQDPHAFLTYPMLVLSLPSLTLGGLLLAALLTAAWARWKALSLLRLLDVFAPGGAFLAAFLELGHALDGSEPGMPLRWRWTGVDLAAQGLRLHPVAAYGVVLSMLLCGILWARLGPLEPPGQLAAVGLMGGGTLAFLLSLISLPAEVDGWPLEPGQMVALVTMVAGALLWGRAGWGESRRQGGDVVANPFAPSQSVSVHTVSETGEDR